jgi:hypothetical protein
MYLLIFLSHVDSTGENDDATPGRGIRVMGRPRNFKRIGPFFQVLKD